MPGPSRVEAKVNGGCVAPVLWLFFTVSNGWLYAPKLGGSRSQGIGIGFLIFVTGLALYLGIAEIHFHLKQPRAKKWRWTTWARLLVAGWRPGRYVWDRLRLPNGLETFPTARRVLTEFGGLKLGDRTEDVRLDPSLSDAECLAEIPFYEGKLGRRLYPVGVIEHQDQVWILLDEQGFVYTLLPTVSLKPYASSFDQAIEFLVAGVNRRAQEDDLRAAGLLGQEWQKDQC
jgi:hypothetical protein